MSLAAVAGSPGDYPKFSDSVSVVVDAEMGRCLVANKAFRPGDILYQESALIYSTYNGRNPHEKILIRSSFPRVVVDRMDEILDDLSNLTRVQSLDTAKNFVLLLAMQKLRNIGKFDIIMNYYKEQGVEPDELREKLGRFDQLTAANLAECNADIRSIRQDYPKLVSQEVSTQEAARLLGIVTTNQLELEELGGSGLFVNTAIFQHDCSPNCSYTTSGCTLYMAATQVIEQGQRLSIDYGNNFYRPTFERLEGLFETYGFRCACATCAGPDKRRPYSCEYCKTGVFFPIGGSNIIDLLPTVCTECGGTPTLEYRSVCLQREQAVLHEPPTTVAQYDALCGEGFLYRTHYLYFWALDDIYLKLSGEARSCYFDSGSGESRRLYSEALIALRLCISLLEWQLPAVHHEKVVYCDRMGQLAVAINDLHLAQESFTVALRHSCLASGSTVPATVAVQKLAENPPKSIGELLEHYKRQEVDGDGEEWEDMEEM